MSACMCKLVRNTQGVGGGKHYIADVLLTRSHLCQQVVLQRTGNTICTHTHTHTHTHKHTHMCTHTHTHTHKHAHTQTCTHTRTFLIHHVLPLQIPICYNRGSLCVDARVAGRHMARAFIHRRVSGSPIPHHGLTGPYSSSSNNQPTLTSCTRRHHTPLHLQAPLHQVKPE